ncbi:MAG: DmsE family decaheme c-type cytochrome [Armatimonadetes bacterium]|nr:DmsE family decaheme c-type cytochrome [Armatimonadota bacterium]
MKPKHYFLVIPLFLVAALVLLGSPLLRGEEAKYTSAADSKLCGKCHKEFCDISDCKIYRNPMYKTTTRLHGVEAEEVGCDACHGPTAQHLQDPSKKEWQTPIKFASFSPSKKIGVCLKCHSDERRFSFRMFSHARNGMACTSCHSNLHGADPKGFKKRDPDLCYDCHREKRAQFRMPSRHPLEEGKMKCSSCHNMHGGATQGLRGENERETCVKCHAEYGGPFAFEHSPVSEKCSICHKSHGSVNNNLLSMPMPMLCLRCHAPQHVGWVRRTTNAFNAANISERLTRGLAYQQCSHCHVKLHGSDQNRAGTY